MQKHVFQIEKLRKVTLYAVLLLLILILALILLFQTSYIQTKISNFITKELSEKLHSKITIDNVKISLFRGFVFKKVYIEDQQQDTLLYLKDLSIIPSGLQIDINDLTLKELRANEVYLNLYKVGKDTLNIQYIIDALNDVEDTTTNNFKYNVQKFAIIDSRLKFNIADSVKLNGIDFKNLNLSNININLNNLLVENENIISEIKNISFKEQSGFIVEELNSKKANINPKQLHLKEFNFKTPTSQIMFDSINFDYPKNYNLSNYKSNLKANISIKNKSSISYNDINIFTSDTINNSEKISISGILKGSYDNFTTSNLNIFQKYAFSLKLNSKIKGLKALTNPKFYINVENCDANIQNISEISFLKKSNFLKEVPVWIKKIKNLKFSGITKGKLSNFTSNGKLFGDFGNIIYNIKTKKDTLSNYNVQGNVFTNKLQIANIIKNKNVGETSFSQDFVLTVSKNKKFKVKTSGRISKFKYNNFVYKDIDLYSEISNKKIDSINVLIDQPLLSARLISKIDFSEKIPKFEIFTNVANADISKLNLVKTKKAINSVKFTADAKFKGDNLNDFFGAVKLKTPLSYKKDSSLYKINKFNLITKNINSEKVISINSDIADAKLITNKNPNATLKLLKNLKDNILSSDILKANVIDTSFIGDPIKIELKIKQANVFMSFINSEYHISDNTQIYGFYDPNKNKINLSLNSKFLKYKNLSVSDFYMIAYTKDNKIFGGIGGSSASPNSYISAKNISLEGDFASDSIDFSLNWNNFKDSANYSANISGKIKIITKENNKKFYDCVLSNSEMKINDILWKFNNANIIIDSTKVSIYDLTLKNGNQKLYLDGNISEYPGDILFAEYENFKISNIQPLIKNNLILKGELSGSTTFAQLYDKPLIFTTDSITKLNVNKINFGNFYFNSNWDSKENKIHANAYNLKGKYRKFMNDTIYGDYWPNTGNIFFTTEVRSMLLKTFEDYYADYASFNSSAYIKGKVALFGNYKKPKLKGNLKLKQGTITIKYLNTIYGMDDMDISFDNKEILLSKTKIQSENTGGYGFVKGKIAHKLFSDFDVDVDIDANNLQVMKLGRTEESYFYGTAYGTGNLNFSGPLKNIYLDANLKTENNTFIFIPMSSSEVLQEEQSYIRFVTDTTVSKTTNNPKEEYTADIGGFTMNLKVDVTPEATMQIIPDENGDIITNGTGSIILNLDSESNFNMFGTYVISKGNYKIKLSKITKEFEINKGSKIIWAGDPKGALVDIDAIYSLDNITLNNLLPNQTDEIEKTKVDCAVNLSGTLLDPNLKLNIILPENVSQKYKSKISSFESKDINEQFLSLLIMRRFFTTIGTDFADSRPLTGDLLTSQLNSLLNKVSKDVDMSVIYQPGQETVTDEYGLELSGSAWDNRITYKGGVGIGGNEVEKKDEAIVGEAEVELKLNRKGNFKAKVYNRANDKLENDGTYTQGAGLIWRQKFDNFFWWKNKKYIQNDTTYENN